MKENRNGEKKTHTKFSPLHKCYLNFLFDPIHMYTSRKNKDSKVKRKPKTRAHYNCIVYEPKARFLFD